MAQNCQEKRATLKAALQWLKSSNFGLRKRAHKHYFRISFILVAKPVTLAILEGTMILVAFP